jgi:serine/threonine protein kinase
MSEQKETLPTGMILEGRYRIVSEGMAWDIGTAYNIYDIQQERLAVLLLLDRRFGQGAEAAERTAAASQAVSDLTQPELLPFGDVGLVEGQIFLVRDHVEGQPLADLLASSGPLEVRTAVDLTIRICEALAPAHRAGLVHGSLSSHSILVGSEGQITVLDTGLLPALCAKLTPPGQPWGRFPYLTPEQAAGERVQPASDVYVVGALLYEMVSGRCPFRADDLTVLALQHLRRDPISLQVLVPAVPPSLVQVVHKSLAKEPALRYRNAGQVAHILRSQVGTSLELPIEPDVPQRAAALTSPEGVRPWEGVRPSEGVRLPEEVRPSEEVRLLEDVRPSEEEKLVVPPPPMPLPPTSRRVEFIYDQGEEDEYWVDEPEGIDWIMIGLIVAALIAVLGLIPLWRTVYRRYTGPLPAPTPASYGWLDPSSMGKAQGLAVDRGQPLVSTRRVSAGSADPAGAENDLSIAANLPKIRNTALAPPAIGANWLPGHLSAIMLWCC